MPTILSHPAVPIAVAIAAGRSSVSLTLLALGVVASIAPDFDGIGFKLGIAYASEFGHRGATHSIVFAVLLASLLGLIYKKLTHGKWWHGFLFTFIATLSHPLLDMCTSGGHGVALLWPFSYERFFFDFRPIRVSPIALSQFISERGVVVLLSELQWVWLPCLALALTTVMVRRRFKRQKN